MQKKDYITVFSLLLNSYFILNIIKKKQIIERPMPVKIEKPKQYEDKYEDYMITKNTVTDYNTLREKYITESTPDGYVIMSFNYDEKEPDCSCFLYYADTIIEFKYLETVARKYVKEYYCSNIYIKEKNKEEIDKKIEKEMVEKKVDKKGGIDKKHFFVKNCNKTSDAKKNRFKQMGSISEYYIMILSPKKTNKPKDVSFSEYKRQAIY